ncbi:MAG: chemotaxis protein CheW [Candidatus Anammoxibacter sp.]
MTETVSSGNANLLDFEGRYLTFFLGDEEYGVEISFVKEIIGVLHITAVPLSENYILGVINLRGKVVPVIDLRLKFGLSKCEPTERSCIVVIEYNRELIGVLVDTVSEVIDIGEDEFDETTFLDQKVDSQYIRGVGKIDGKIKILIDIKKVLACEEMDIV